MCGYFKLKFTNEMFLRRDFKTNNYQSLRLKTASRNNIISKTI